MQTCSQLTAGGKKNPENPHNSIKCKTIKYFFKYNFSINRYEVHKGSINESERYKYYTIHSKNVGYPSGTAMLMGMCVCLNGTTAPMTSKTTLKYP